jgi:hypothetical protein
VTNNPASNSSRAIRRPRDFIKHSFQRKGFDAVMGSSIRGYTRAELVKEKLLRCQDRANEKIVPRQVSLFNPWQMR